MRRSVGKKIQSEEEGVDPLQPIGKTVVGHPNGPDRQEAHEVGEECRPGSKELHCRRARWSEGNVENEQGDGERQHAIAETLHPALSSGALALGVSSSVAKAPPKVRA